MANTGTAASAITTYVALDVEDGSLRVQTNGNRLLSDVAFLLVNDDTLVLNESDARALGAALIAAANHISEATS